MIHANNGHASGARTSPTPRQPPSRSRCFILASFLTILVLLLIPFAIVEIVLGAQFWDSCPIERLVPIYLVFSGCLGLVVCGMCVANFLAVFGYCKHRCCTVCKEWRVGATVCLAVMNCMWLVCGFGFVYKADSLHLTDDITSLTSTLPSYTYQYCNNSLLNFAKAALYIRTAFLAFLLIAKQVMYFDKADLEPKVGSKPLLS